MISAVPQNRFAAPQRVQRQAFGSIIPGNDSPIPENKKTEDSSKKSELGIRLGYTLLLATSVIGIPFAMHNSKVDGAEARDKQLIPLIDSLSNHKINAGNVDAFIQKREIAQQADSLLKAASRIKP